MPRRWWLLVAGSLQAWLWSCQEHEQKPLPSVVTAVEQDPQSEQRTLARMLAVLDQSGLSFDAPTEATRAPAHTESNAQRERAVLELQTMLQTEIEVMRRRLQKSEPEAPSVQLLQKTRAALDRNELAAFIREVTRPEPGKANDAALLLTELEAQVRSSIQRRIQRLSRP